MDPYIMRDNKFDPKFRKNFVTSHLISDIYLRIVSILITSEKFTLQQAMKAQDRRNIDLLFL
jgi:hypothetical protein